MKKTQKNSSKKTKVSDDTTIANTDQVQKFGYFITPIYYIEKPEFLELANKVSEELLDKHKQEFPDLHPIYPIRQTESLLNDSSLAEFFNFVGGTAWNALASEGYDMRHFSVHFQEAWTQEHYMHSGHDEHVHPYGSQIIGFYFLDTPENSGSLVFHDPRPAKRQINLPEADMRMATDASTAINFEPKAGDLYFAPSWVPHSISRHGGDSPLRLVHITMGVIPNQQTLQSNQETMSTATVI